MNSAEVLVDNKKAIEAIQNQILSYIQKLNEGKDLGLEVKPYAIDAYPHDVNHLGLLKFLAGKNVGTYAIGYSDTNFMKLWTELCPPKPVDPNAPNKAQTHEFELVKNLFIALDPELKTKKINADPKTAMIQEGASLGPWKTMTFQQVIKLPIGTKGGDLIFEIPVFDAEFVKKFTLDTFGFKQDTRVLVVDDSLVSRKFSRSCLAMAGFFNVDEAPDGDAAFNKVASSTPRFELVVLDWHMPNMSGFELLKKIRAINEFKKLPVIMLTGEKNKEEVISALKEGASGYLIKPADPESFFKSMKKAGGRA